MLALFETNAPLQMVAHGFGTIFANQFQRSRPLGLLMTILVSPTLLLRHHLIYDHHHQQKIMSSIGSAMLNWQRYSLGLKSW